MNTPVSFPLAKLLNSIGFKEYCSSGYTKTGDRYFHQSGDIRNGQSYYNGRYYTGGEFYCSAPTAADVVMWLYKNHKIWISVDPEIDTNTWFHTITHNKSETVFGNYSTLTEAYEKGIEHVINNLI